MTNSKIQFLGKMQKLILNDNDVLVLHANILLTHEQKDNLRVEMQQQFPGVKVLLVQAGLKLGVVAVPDIKVVVNGSN